MPIPKKKHTAATKPVSDAKPGAKKKIKPALQTKSGRGGNNYPNILVHGFCGWGRDEIFGQRFRYFGGAKGDIQEYLKSKGYKTFTASVGPLSGNWDRACELYAFIRGGVVDYGAVHSARYGHARYGRSYPGILPEWDEEHKVHLIGHSQGGPTVRTLVHLLENGDPDETAFIPGTYDAPSSNLFKGGKKWVHSVTTVAGVHNGTPCADDFGELIKGLLNNVATMAGAAGKEPLFDFNLPQWDLIRKKGETISAYFKRIMFSPLWKSDDCSVYDLSLVAAHFQNTLVKTSKNVYYTSYAVDGTFPGPFNKRLPIPNMNPALKGGSILMGANTRELPGGAENWRPNDGAVPVPSAQYPFGHAHEFINPAKPLNPKKGVWYVHPTLTNKDHISIITPWLDVTIEELNAFYEGIAKYNKSLPTK